MTAVRQGARVLVVGGGVVGCAVALRLAEDGAEVTVLERAVPGAEASTVAAGILGPGAESRGTSAADTTQFNLGSRARDTHARWAERLRAETGIDVGYRACGVFEVAFDESDAATLRHKAAFLVSNGAATTVVDGIEARMREPSLSAEVLLAVDHESDGQVEPPVFLRTVALLAQRRGVRFLLGATVRGLRIGDSRVHGVDVDEGTLEADAVVVAAGAWTSLVPGMPASARAIQPVRGQILSSETRPPAFRRVVFGAGAYVVTRPDGRLLVGATSEHVGFSKEVTFGGVGELIGKACRIAPALANAPVLGHAVSFRPGSPDHLPLVGRDGPDGLYVASGHHRNGILLAPLTAELVADELLHGKRDPALDVLRPDRFSETQT